MMKLLSICDPSRYNNALLDVPTFYQRAANDPRLEFYHLPLQQVSTHLLPNLPARLPPKTLPYSSFLTLDQCRLTNLNLSEIDLVFCRTLKPFPAQYLEQLSRWEAHTRFVNSPTNKQTQIKSDFLLNVAAGYIPETIVTDNITEVLTFFDRFKTIVAKRANSTGGKGVFKIWYETQAFYVDNVIAGTRSFSDFSSVMAYLQTGQIDPLQFCRFLHRTDAGDKRVVVVDGEIYGSYLRKSKQGHWVNNVSIDGECTLTDISTDEVEAIQETSKHYQALGLHTLGYDFLMDNDHTWRISEINVGNVGGFSRLELLTGKPVISRLIDWLIDYAKQSNKINARTMNPIRVGSV